jgi:energy-coupling factor transporter ATP-binding protein EcfA2
MSTNHIANTNSMGIRLLGVEIIFKNYPTDSRGRIWVPIENGRHVLYGKNGAGKSTILEALISAISGIRKPNAEWTVDLFIEIDQDVWSWGPEEFQEFENEDEIEVNDDDACDAEHSEDFKFEVSNPPPKVVSGFVKSMIKSIPHTDFWREFLSEKLYFNNDADALEEFQNVAIGLGMKAPNITAEQYLATDWSNLFVSFEDAIRCMLVWQLKNDESFWNADEERPHRELVAAAFEEIAMGRIIKLSPIGQDKAKWSFSPAGLLDGSMPCLSQLLEIQNEIIDNEISEYVHKYGSDFPLGIPSAYLNDCQESEYLSETYPTQAFAYSESARLNQLRMRAVHPYIAAEGWNCSAEFSVNSMDGFYQLLNLNKHFSVDDWIKAELSRVFGLGDWELLWSGKKYSLENQFDLTSDGFESFQNFVSQIGSDLASLQIGLSDLRVDVSSNIRDWIGGSPFALSAKISHSGDWAPYKSLSSAQKNSVDIAIQLNYLKRRSEPSSRSSDVIVVGDEIDNGFHLQAVDSLYRYIALNVPIAYVASHSPVALRTPWLSKIHVNSDDQNRVHVSALEVEGPVEDIAEELGVMASDLLGLKRGFVMVEGEHDVAVIKGLFDHLPDFKAISDQIDVIPMRGHRNMAAESDSKIILSYTSASLLFVVDNARNDELSGLRGKAIQLLNSGMKPEKVIAELKLRDSRDSSSPEERTIYQIMERSIQKRQLSRINFFGLSVKDVIMLFSPEHFGLNQSWQELEVLFGARVDRQLNFKDFLRSQGATISTAKVRAAISAIERDWPSDLLALANALAEIVYSNTINEMF